ncbi:zinc knuckle-domain-containing protein [Coniochaeta sp. 2T2.1]|nr:zinc knuckle-domain-containing protein [Coniochaeta sp. 2T2.1]
MYGYRGKGGPSRSTPSNVTCQKCLKKGHYSYECKASAQERPYVPRPSRTQQLLNPKLVPKLNTEVLDDLLQKKGVADEELAKREAERAKKRQLEDLEHDDVSADHKSAHKRHRSVSPASVSSTSSRSPSSQPRRRVDSPPQPRASLSPDGSKSKHPTDVSRPPRPRRRRGYESDSEGSGRSARSLSPDEQIGRRTRRDISPVRGTSRRADCTRDSPASSHGYGARGEGRGYRRSAHSRSPSRSPKRERSRSRSPAAAPSRRYRTREEAWPAATTPEQQAQRTQPPPPPRERSLSPFSKRLALTQAMNMGR